MANSAMLTSALFKMQGFVHGGDSKVLPSLLMLGAISMLVYRHVAMSEEDLQFIQEEGSDSLKKFLGMIILQMLPLIFLELKILSCPDPVSLLSRFGPKVTLMHAIFLTLRIFIQPDYAGWNVWNYAGVLGAAAVLCAGFKLRCSPSAILGHSDVWFLVALAFVAAWFTNVLDVILSGSTFDMQATSQLFAEYIEIMAFVPAVWTVHQASKSSEAAKVTTSDPRTQALYFFGFLVAFYTTEDVCNAYAVSSELPLAAAGHIMHFMLLLDFAGFLLAHFFNPENLKGTLMRWLPDAVVPMV